MYFIIFINATNKTDNENVPYLSFLYSYDHFYLENFIHSQEMNILAKLVISYIRFDSWNLLSMQCDGKRRRILLLNLKMQVQLSITEIICF